MYVCKSISYIYDTIYNYTICNHLFTKPTYSKLLWQRLWKNDAFSSRSLTGAGASPLPWEFWEAQWENYWKLLRHHGMVLNKILKHAEMPIRYLKVYIYIYIWWYLNICNIYWDITLENLLNMKMPWNTKGLRITPNQITIWLYTVQIDWTNTLRAWASKWPSCSAQSKGVRWCWPAFTNCKTSCPKFGTFNTFRYMLVHSMHHFSTSWSQDESMHTNAGDSCPNGTVSSRASGSARSWIKYLAKSTCIQQNQVIFERSAMRRKRTKWLNV